MDHTMWEYRPECGTALEQSLVGFTVHAADGVIGQVDRQDTRPGIQHVIVDTGMWVFGKSVLIPAGAVVRIDSQARTMTIGNTRQEIKAAPRFTVDRETTDLAYLSDVGHYYLSLNSTSVL
ncbi:PRC-barrel domain containing protein [Streptomyces sp. NPDC002055]|uniref:PRC-barrel domain containing protein n=1 Tax=Streptomyces sp. NPDC002055 TaxID=3154534 RepID=UPI00332D3A91